jgi:CBS domain-containing membrane protein
MNLAANIGPEDLARLIGVAEAEAAARHIGGLTAADLMSRDVLTILPDAHPAAIAEMFRAHRFKTLPVAGPDGAYLGLLSQAELMGLADERVEAEQIMSTTMRTVTPDTPVSLLLMLIADGGQQALPVLDGRRLVGLVTRSDMIGALAQTFAR